MKSCILCGSANIETFLSIEEIPVYCNILWQTREQAVKAPQGDIQLAACSNCGHIFNLAFNPDLTEYSQAYDNSLHFSPTFQEYARDLAHNLIEKYSLVDKEIIEIGSGQGEFLSLLCDYGNNQGLGFDPSYIQNAESVPQSGNFSIIPDYYSARYKDYGGDFFCARHVLEHLDQPGNFLTLIAGALQGRPGALVYLEVPDARYTFQGLSIWDIIYEHPSYFSPSSLSYALKSNGFDILDLDTSFGGQFLYAVAKLNDGPDAHQADGDLPERRIAFTLEDFTMGFKTTVNKWSQILNERVDEKNKIVVWGAGSKGVTFLNLFKQLGAFEYVVDINPRKWGKFIPISGQLVVSPDFMTEYKPHLIIIMNTNYEQEIKTMVAGFEINPEFITVL